MLPCERIYFGVKISVTGAGVVPCSPGCQRRNWVGSATLRSYMSVLSCKVSNRGGVGALRTYIFRC